MVLNMTPLTRTSAPGPPSPFAPLMLTLPEGCSSCLKHSPSLPMQQAGFYFTSLRSFGVGPCHPAGSKSSGEGYLLLILEVNSLLCCFTAIKNKKRHFVMTVLEQGASGSISRLILSSVELNSLWVFYFPILSTKPWVPHRNLIPPRDRGLQGSGKSIF